MLQLIDLVDNTRTDKNTCHSYLPVYQKLFEPKKYDNNNILEIGIGEPKKIKKMVVVLNYGMTILKIQ